MQISRINNTNFKGLWFVRNEQIVGKEGEANTPIYRRDVIYYPFKDESNEETQDIFEKASAKNVYEVYDIRGEEQYSPEKFVIVKPTVGEKLNYTQKDYELMQNLKSAPCLAREGYEEFNNIDSNKCQIYPTVQNLAYFLKS